MIPDSRFAAGQRGQQLEVTPTLAGVTHTLVDTGELRMHVAEAGSGPPCVLLHGWPQHWFLWSELIPELARRYRVIAPDLRGSGWSDAPQGGYDKRVMARDVLRLLDVLGIDQQIRLVGHDWGGWCGFVMCAERPELFERFVALNIPPPWATNHNRSARAVARLWYQVSLGMPVLGPTAVRGPARGILRRMIRQSSINPDTWSDRRLDVFLDRLDDPARARATSRLYRTFLTRELPQLMTGRYLPQRLTTPTRLIYGTQDIAVDRSLIERDHSRYADSIEVELVEDCGHFIVDERPQLVLERVLDFFEGG